MNGVLVLDSTDVMAVGAGDVGGEFGGSGVGVLLDLFDHLVDLSSNFFLIVLELSLLGPVVLEDNFSAKFDRIAGKADISDFLLGSVRNTGVGHGVTMVSVAAHLNDNGSVLDGVSSSELDGFTDVQDVLCFNLESRNFISSSIIVSVMGVTLVRSSHGV